MKYLKLLFVSLIFVPLILSAWKMESATTTLPATTVGSTEWVTVTLQQTYDVVPLIFVVPDDSNAYSSDTPAAVRIRNVTKNSFEIVQVEPSDDGAHSAMTIPYLAIEPGTYDLNGHHIVAASIGTQTQRGKIIPIDTWETVSISGFTSKPIVLGSIQTLANENALDLPGTISSPWMTTAIRNVTSGNFDITIERAETSAGTVSNNELIAYMVIDAGIQSFMIDAFTCTSISFETLLSGDSVKGWDNGCYSYNFNNTYSSLPNVIGKQQTRDGGDGGWLRSCGLSTTDISVTIDEDQANDVERKHTTEEAGFIIFEKDFVYDSTLVLNCNLLTDYHTDECYWFDNANGISGDVKDNSLNSLDGTSNGIVQPVIDAKIGRSSGYFEDADNDGISDGFVNIDHNNVLDVTNGITVSAWVKAIDLGTDWAIVTSKFSSQNWSDGWGLFHWGGHADELGFIVFTDSGGTAYAYVTGTVSLNTWTHIVGVYDGVNVKFYIDGAEVASQAKTGNILNNTTSMDIGAGKTGSGTNEPFEGNIDEVKVWDRALSTTEISEIYTNESVGKNYNGTTRSINECEANIGTNSWELIGIPAESRSTTVGVQEVFGDDFIGANYNAGASGGWILYKRNYDPVTNDANYSKVDYANNEAIVFGESYWLGSTVDTNWSTNNLVPVDYDGLNCASFTNKRCVEIPLHAVSSDGTDGSGPYRYNMTGFIGKSPVDWATCRFDIDGTIYSPTAAHNAGLINKTIWQYGGGAGSGTGGQVLSTDYTSCDDTTPGGCLLLPYHGFWIEMNSTTLGSTVKLLIPEE